MQATGRIRVIVQDNGSIHKSKDVQQKWSDWGQGLYIFFLPQYCSLDEQKIPRLLTYFEENQEFYLVQEFIKGHELSQELTLGKQLGETYVIALLEDVLPILEFIHQQGVINQDIKPSNLIRREHDDRPEQVEVAKQLAREFDSEAQRRGFKSLEIGIKRGSQLTFYLVIPGLQIDPLSS